MAGDSEFERYANASCDYVWVARGHGVGIFLFLDAFPVCIVCRNWVKLRSVRELARIVRLGVPVIFVAWPFAHQYIANR